MKDKEKDTDSAIDHGSIAEGNDIMARLISKRGSIETDKPGPELKRSDEEQAVKSKFMKMENRIRAGLVEKGETRLFES